MNWWQLTLYFLGLVAISALLGLLLGYILRRLKNKPWPFSWPNNGNHNVLSPGKKTVIPVTRIPQNPSTGNISPGPFPKRVEDYNNKIKQPIVVKGTSNDKSKLLIEIESNLKIAKLPQEGKLVTFNTTVFEANLRQSEFLPPELKDELAEAYTDMTLANVLVGLSTDIGSESREIHDSYARLCGKIAERLEKAVATLSRNRYVPN